MEDFEQSPKLSKRTVCGRSKKESSLTFRTNEPCIRRINERRGDKKKLLKMKKIMKTRVDFQSSKNSILERQQENY